MAGWEDDGGDDGSRKESEDERKPSLANVMVFHQSFERTSRAIELDVKGRTKMVKVERIKFC